MLKAALFCVYVPAMLLVIGRLTDDTRIALVYSAIGALVWAGGDRLWRNLSHWRSRPSRL